MKKLLIVVDYQNDFVTGALGFEGARQIEAALCRKIESYQAQGADVVYTMDTHGEDYAQTQEGKKLPVPHCMEGTQGWALYGRCAQLLKGCRQFKKGTFGSMELAQWLVAQGYNAVELCGVVTNICVLSNAVLCKAALPEAEITVDAACVAGADEALNRATFDVLRGIHVNVIG